MATRFRPFINPNDPMGPTTTGTATPTVDYDPALDPNAEADPNAVHRGGNAIPAGDFHLYFTMIIGLAGL
jgi:hypothetical protein